MIALDQIVEGAIYLKTYKNIWIVNTQTLKNFWDESIEKVRIVSRKDIAETLIGLELRQIVI